MARYVSSGGSAAATAASVSYDNVASGLSATNAKAALDELAAGKQAVNSGKSVPHALGTVSTGTTTPEPSAGAVKTLTNGGAFTWAAPTEEGGYVCIVTNNATAGAITASGFDEAQAANFTTTNLDKFEVCVTNIGGQQSMTVRALQ
ncbi:MAG: hypothetical protein ACE5FM_02070 [Methyloligellaceae bacterium]